VPPDAPGWLLGTGVAGGTGAYVQPAALLVHAATTRMLTRAVASRVSRMGNVGTSMLPKGRSCGDSRRIYPVPGATWRRHAVEGTRTHQYHRPDCPGRVVRVGSRSPSAGALGPRRRSRGPSDAMAHHRLTRIWHLAIAVAPIVILGLTLVAGRRW